MELRSKDYWTGALNKTNLLFPVFSDIPPKKCFLANLYAEYIQPKVLEVHSEF